MGSDEKWASGHFAPDLHQGFWIGMSKEENRSREAGLWHTTRACASFLRMGHCDLSRLVVPPVAEHPLPVQTSLKTKTYGEFVP